MRNRVTPQCITSLKEDEVFVFSSNIAGHHARGNAFRARSWGAVMGNGKGLQGRTYAIPAISQTVEEIKVHIDEFITFAKTHSERIFLVTDLGCDEHWFFEIAPLFFQAISCDNIYLPGKYWSILMKDLRGRMELIAYHRSCSFAALSGGISGISSEDLVRMVAVYEESLHFIQRLSREFPEVNEVWLKTGKGDYLNNSISSNSDSTIDDILAML